MVCDTYDILSLLVSPRLFLNTLCHFMVLCWWFIPYFLYAFYFRFKAFNPQRFLILHAFLLLMNQFNEASFNFNNAIIDHLRLKWHVSLAVNDGLDPFLACLIQPYLISPCIRLCDRLFLWHLLLHTFFALIQHLFSPILWLFGYIRLYDLSILWSNDFIKCCLLDFLPRPTALIRGWLRHNLLQIRYIGSCLFLCLILCDQVDLKDFLELLLRIDTR